MAEMWQLDPILSLVKLAVMGTNSSCSCPMLDSNSLLPACETFKRLERSMRNANVLATVMKFPWDSKTETTDDGYGAMAFLWQATQTTDAAGYLICKYSATTATGLAVGALVCLLVAQLFITIVTRCLCCGVAYSPGAARTWAVVAFIISW